MIVYKKIDKITPYFNNARIHDNYEVIKESIKEFGFKNPIIIDKQGVIICGHGRYASAIDLGYSEIPCIVAEHLTDEQVKAYRIADNSTAEVSSWDFEKLEREIENIDIDLTCFGFDFITEPPDDFFDEPPKQEKTEKQKKTIVCQCCGKEFEV